jgi:hypothetical protein
VIGKKKFIAIANLFLSNKKYIHENTILDVIIIETIVVESRPNIK